jgi:hypothetical protein
MRQKRIPCRVHDLQSATTPSGVRGAALFPALTPALPTAVPGKPSSLHHNHDYDGPLTHHTRVVLFLRLLPSLHWTSLCLGTPVHPVHANTRLHGLEAEQRIQLLCRRICNHAHVC